MKYKLFAVMALLLLVLIFIIQNAAIVDISIFFWTIKVSRILLMFIILIIGIIAGYFLNSYIRHRSMSDGTDE